MSRTAAFIAAACIACTNAYVHPSRPLLTQQLRSRRAAVTRMMSDPMKESMSDPDAKGFAYDALAPIYGNNPLKGVASGVAKKETGRRAPVPGKEKSLFQKVGPLVFFSAVPTIIG